MIDAGIIKDNHAKGTLPKHFSYSNDLTPDQTPSCTAGLDKLNVMGSAQYSEAQLKAVLKKYPEQKIYLIDLRQETHWQIDGKPYSWYQSHNHANVGKSEKLIEQDENSKAQIIQSFKEVVYYDHYTQGFEQAKKLTSPVTQVETEAQMAKRLGVPYKRFYIPDHCRPSDGQVEAFLSFYLSLPNHVTLYFHCKGGRGRRTTFTTMLDMMHNAHQLTFDEIMQRQKIICNKDLSLVKHEGENAWREPLAKERLAFLKDFYVYIRDDYALYMSWRDYSLNYIGQNEHKTLLPYQEMKRRLDVNNEEQEGIKKFSKCAFK